MYFVCRWRDQSPFSKWIVRLPDATVLDWFRRHWNRDDEPFEWLRAELGGPYGLESIFEAVVEHELPMPDSVDRLRELLHEHLWVEGDPEKLVRLDERSLRVRTDDDETDLAYFFFHDAAPSDRLAYLLNETWPLPALAVDGPFDHDVHVRPVDVRGTGPGSVFSVRIAYEYDGIMTNLDLEGAVVFSGLALPDLASALTLADDDGWPSEAGLLRELLLAADGDLAAAMHHYSRLEGYGPSVDGARHDGSKSQVSVDEHIVQVARYINDFWGYDQWFLFDTEWAAAQPDLARSLLRYAAQWDPFRDAWPDHFRD